MNDSFEFLEDKQAYASLLDVLSPYKKTANMVRLATSLGACIAGGSAVSLLQKKTKQNVSTMKDIDLWFPDEKSMDTFLFSTKMDPEISTKISFGGHAVDIHVRELGRSVPLQVITFRCGNPVEIISQFDFKNCAVAVTPDGFWYHKEVPELLKNSKLSLLNDNSAFFLSRVEKYIRKGFVKFDVTLTEKVYSHLNSMLDKVMQSVQTYNPDTQKPMKDFDSEYVPIKTASSRIVNLTYRFMSQHTNIKTVTLSSGMFTDEQYNVLNMKTEFLTEFQKKIGRVRAEEYNLPYGYYSAKSSEQDTLDSLFGDI